jgi:hypothetical protein
MPLVVQASPTSLSPSEFWAYRRRTEGCTNVCPPCWRAHSCELRYTAPVVMSDGEEKMNFCKPLMQDEDRGVHSSVIVLVVACIAMVLLSIAVSGYGIWKILETTPFMGILVDARGNRIPIQGFPQLWLGSMGVLVFIFLSVICWLECDRIRFGLLTLLIAMTLIAVVLGVYVAGR